ncbi:hypothetical protein V8F06_010727 [Rhypophila decipiens]
MNMKRSGSLALFLRRDRPPVMSNEDINRIFADSETQVSAVIFARDDREHAPIGSKRCTRYATVFTDAKCLISSFKGQQILTNVIMAQHSSSSTPRDTWNRILLPFDAFLHLHAHLQASDSLTRLAGNFGLRLQASDEMHISFTSRERIRRCIKSPVSVSQPSTATDTEPRDSETRVTEICYNIRYYARHGRPGVRSTWSERQAGVFHSLDEDMMISQVVTIQLPERPKNAVEEMFGSVLDPDEEDPSLERHLAFHVSIFMHLSWDWRPYLCFLEALLAELEITALNSRVGEGNEETYSLTFRNAQRLEKLRRKLSKARHILSQNTEVARRWIQVAEALALRHGRGEEVGPLVASAKEYIAELDSHRAVTDLLQDRLSGTERLIYHTLNYRNEEQVIQSTLPLNGSNEKLLVQLSRLSSRHDAVHDIASEFVSDSKLIKILTLVTVIYAPASFATSLFNTNVIANVPVSEDAPQTRLALAPGFWALPLLVLGLVALTLLGMWAWWRHGPRLWARYRRFF